MAELNLTFDVTFENDSLDVNEATSAQESALTITFAKVFKGDKGDKGDTGEPGTTDFEELENRPSYNGSVMDGDTDIPEVPTKTSDLENDSGFLTEHQSLSEYRKSSAQDAIDATKADKSTTYTKAETDSLLNDKQDTISDLATIRSNASAGKTASDNLGGHTVGKDVPSDAVFTDTVYDDTALKARIATIEGKESGWDAKLNDAPSDDKQYARKNGSWQEVEGGSGGTTDFEQLTNRPKYNGTTMDRNTDIPEVPTKTSDLTNDSGFLTQHQDISGKADKSTTYTKTEVDTLLDGKADSEDIPTKTSDLTNDSGFLTEHNIVIISVAVPAATYTGTLWADSLEVSTLASIKTAVTAGKTVIIKDTTKNLYLPYVGKDTQDGSDSYHFVSLMDFGDDRLNSYSLAFFDGTGAYGKINQVMAEDDLATVATSGSYDDLINKPTIPTVTNDYTNEEKQKVADAYADKHTHSNKALLDTYTQTEANLADAVSKKHQHSNMSVLEGITAALVSTWNAKSAVSVSASGTATDEVGYITIDGVEKKIAGGGSSPTIETHTIATSGWSALASSSPFTYQATLTATETIGASTIVELLNDDAVTFATYGFCIGAVSGQSVTIYSIGAPSASVTLKLSIQ